MESTLLQTKLFVPPARAEQVSRPRLVERLNAGSRGKLSLISAPAGFGKTTLVGEWVQAMDGATPPIAVAWLSLDESDNDPTRFLTYFVAALQTVQADAGKGALIALQSPQPPPAEAVLTDLINEIAALPGQVVLVLDDYHLIEAQPIHDALAFLLRRLPPQLHLTITTREDPPLPLARLRARGQLTELRATDLRFTVSEAAEFLNQAMGLDLSPEDVAALEQRTEGWIAGLQLAAVSMQGRRDASSFIESFTGSHRHILDYLVEEVLEQQSESVQTFLLQTSILDRLTGPLCDAVCFGSAETHTEKDNGQAILEHLDQANLFLVSLDDERRWYRYHHLFADLLRQRLRQSSLIVSARESNERGAIVAELHIRASEWYEQNGLPSEAIHHALVAKDFERAASLAELAWPDWSGPVQSIEWLGWVKALPEELVRTRPTLSVAYAQALLNAGELEAAETQLLNTEEWMESMSDQPESPLKKRGVVDKGQLHSLRVSLATARAYHAQAIGDLSGTVMYTQRVLDLLPEGNHFMRGAATMLLGLAYWASGDLETAHRTFSDGVAGIQPAGNMLNTMDAVFVLADMKMVLGRLGDAIKICEHALQLVKEHGEPMPQGTEDVYTAMSKLHREQGDLDAAAQDLVIGERLGKQIELPDWQYRWCIAQARLKETLGDRDGALDLLDEAERLYVRTPLPDVRPISALRTRVWVAQGRLAEALSWVRERDLSIDDDLSYLREFEHIVLVRVLIAEYKNNRAERAILEAMELLARLLKAAEEGRRIGSAIEILVLQALAYEAQDNIPLALAPLERALAMAEPEGYVRTFVDEGPPMARLLYEALARGIAPDYVRRLLAAFPDVEPERDEPSAANDELIEPLSERELEVLHLIAEGLTNPEIAARLYLSPHTIKAHARNIYGKLNVHSRTQAIARSQALGILSRQ